MRMLPTNQTDEETEAQSDTVFVLGQNRDSSMSLTTTAQGTARIPGIKTDIQTNISVAKKKTNNTTTGNSSAPQLGDVLTLVHSHNGKLLGNKKGGTTATPTGMTLECIMATEEKKQAHSPTRKT